MTHGFSGISRRVLPVVAILALSGCSDLDVFGLFEDDTPAPQTASEQDLRERSDAQRDAAADSDTPSLTSVPNRPARGSSAVRDRVVEGLIADRDNARYTDEAIRLQGSTRTTETPQAASRPATPTPPPAPAPSQIAVTPPPPPAPATPPPATRTTSTPQIANIPSTRPTPPPAPAAPAAPAVQPVVTPPPAFQRPAATPAPQLAAVPSNQAVSVDLSVLGGGSAYAGSGGYVPVSAQISPEAQVAAIQFNHSSARLGSRDRQVINAVASTYRNTGGRILVVGHASSRTAQMPKNRHELANFNVSFARANAVAQALIGAGISPERVTVEAVSDDQPIYSEAMPTGEAGNRRAEIFVLR